MSEPYAILLLDDEPLILMDLQYAGEDCGYRMLCATNCKEAHRLISAEPKIDAAILDVSLADDCTCAPVAEDLEKRGIPFLLHSGDFDRRDGDIRKLDAPLIGKPAASETVIAAIVAMIEDGGGGNHSVAAE